MQALELTNRLAAELDIHAAMDSVRRVAAELLRCEDVRLFLVADARQELRARLPGGPGGADVPVVVKFGQGIVGRVAQTGELMNVADVRGHPLYHSRLDALTGNSTTSLLATAIADADGKTLAVLIATNRAGGGPFTRQDEAYLRLFGAHLANTLSKARLHEEAKRERARLAALGRCFKRLSGVVSFFGFVSRVCL
jgi:GAF domain-containing protein